MELIFACHDYHDYHDCHDCHDIVMIVMLTANLWHHCRLVFCFCTLES